MTFIEDVQRAKSPREAMLNLAAGLDIIVERLDHLEIQNNWDSWGDYNEAPITAADIAAIDVRRAQAPAITEQDGETTVDIPPTSPEKQAARRMFADQQLGLTEYLKDPSQDWNEVYAKGGPQWLYIGNRELVMSLPFSTRRAMVADLEEDSPQQAHEMARDILKEAADATGYGNSPALADEFAGGVTGIRGTG